MHKKEVNAFNLAEKPLLVFFQLILAYFSLNFLQLFTHTRRKGKQKRLLLAKNEMVYMLKSQEELYNKVLVKQAIVKRRIIC